MILPGKHIGPDRALLTIGSEILAVMEGASTVSDVWERVRASRALSGVASPLPFDWFVLALSLLYAVRAIDLDGETLTRGSAR